MNPECVAPDQLRSRVSELYSGNTLNIDGAEIEQLTARYSNAAKQVVSRVGVGEQREWSSYGCGFASFLESWFFREEKRFEATNNAQRGKCYSGVTVIFSLLEPMFAVGQGEKQWDSSGGGGLLPSLQMIDEFASEAVAELSQEICQCLRLAGIPQVRRRTLEGLIDPAIQIESNMSFGPLTTFDAFFHWMD